MLWNKIRFRIRNCQRKLSTFVSFGHQFAWTWINLRALALTLVDLKLACNSTHVFHPLATQRKSTQVDRKSCHLYMREIWGVLCELGCRLANPFGHPSQVVRSQVLVLQNLNWLALTCESVGPGQAREILPKQYCHTTAYTVFAPSLCTYQFVTSTSPSPPGVPRAFDTLPFPVSREFDFRTAVGLGIWHQATECGEFHRLYTRSEEKMLSDLADKILCSWPNGWPKIGCRNSGTL